jgi:hypothetical protein
MYYIAFESAKYQVQNHCSWDCCILIKKVEPKYYSTFMQADDAILFMANLEGALASADDSYVDWFCSGYDGVLRELEVCDLAAGQLALLE